MSLLEDLWQKKIAQLLYRGMHKERYLRAKSRTIREEEHEDAWPLTVPEVELFWSDGAIFVRANGTLYWVNGLAPAYLRGIGEEVRDIKEIWRTDPATPGLMVNVSLLFDLARGLEHAENPPAFTRWWWRRWELRLIKVLFAPLVLALGVIGLILKGLTAVTRRLGGIVVVVFLLILSGFTTGLLFQELCGAFIGLWQEPFWDHGIFYVIGGIVGIPLAIVAYLVKHQDQDGRR